MKITDIKVLKEGTLSIDVPNEDWLQEKIDYAKSKGRNSYGVPYMGSTTASVRGTPPKVRVLRLASLPGMRNEQTNVRKDDLKWLMDYMDTHKKLPPMGSNPDEEYLPYIMVAYNGEAWVNEGNHRIMAAYRLNWPDMPIEIRYFDGGERVKNGAMYPGKIGLGEVETPKTESMTEIFEPGKQNWKWRRQSSDEAFASFIVADREYQWHAFNSDANTTKWEIQFRLMRVPADPDGLDLFGQTGTGNSAEVLSTAVDITRAFLQAYGLDKVEEITFNAKEDSRIDLYAKMIRRLLPMWHLSSRKSLSHGMQFTLTDPRAYDKPENKITEAESTGWTALEVVESILGKGRVTADEDELVQGMYYVYESNSPPAFEDTEELGQTGGAIRLHDLEATDPQAIAEAAHEACHAYAHSKSTSGMLYTNEKIINNLAEIWLRKNLSGTALHFALEHILGSKLHYGPDHMARSVTEAFDQPYAMTWEKSEADDSMDALARLPDGSNLSIMFNMEYDEQGEEVIQVEFHRNNSQEVTGDGDAQRVFATLLAAIQQYIKEHNPKRLTFSASKEVEPDQNSESRAKLYDRLVIRYARTWGYRPLRADTGSIVRYELSRIKPVAEARTNPEQNTRPQSGMKELMAVADTIADPQNWAISMTAEPKLGINPQVGISEDTPKGIYFYPLDYAVGMIKSRKPMPWGNNLPYIQLFQYDRSGEMTKETQVDSAKLKQALGQYCSQEIMQSAIDEPEYDGTPYWFIYDCLSRLGKSDETNIVRWNKVLRDLGFTSVYDDGHGWIAYNEPTQGVVLDPRVIKQLRTIDNKKESGVITPALIEQTLFDNLDVELASSRAWQAYDPDGSKLKQHCKEWAQGADFKPWFGKDASALWDETQKLVGLIGYYRRTVGREINNQAWEWYRAQQAPKTESITEGGWASTATQNTVITPRTVAEIIHILDGFEASYNVWQARNELDAEIKIGKPKGSGTYYRRDLEQDPEREYGDVDVECFIHSREGAKSAQRITEYRRAINDYCAQSPDFSTDNGTNVIMRTTDGPAQVDLIYTYHEHADWSRVLSPEYRVKGVISTSLTSSVAEALNLSFSSQGIQVKIRNNQPVSFRQSKDTELRTVSINPDNWAQDIYSLYYYLSHGEKPAEMPRDLQAHGGLKDEQRLSDIVLSIKALAGGLEEANLLAHGALIAIANKRDLIRRVAQIYSDKLAAAENSSKFDKASTPAAVEKAKKTKLMLAKYRNEVTKLLLN